MSYLSNIPGVCLSTSRFPAIQEKQGAALTILKPQLSTLFPPSLTTAPGPQDTDFSIEFSNHVATSPLPPTQTSQEQGLIPPSKGQNLSRWHSHVRSQFCLAGKREGWIAFWRKWHSYLLTLRLAAATVGGRPVQGAPTSKRHRLLCWGQGSRMTYQHRS